MSPAMTGVVIAAKETPNPLLPATYDIVWSAVVFAVLFVLFWRYVLPRYLKVLDDRTATIEGGIERAEQAQAEANARLKEYSDQLAEAREEAGRIREQARGEGAAIIAEMRERAQVEADRVTEQAQRQLEAERQQAVAQLRGEVGRLAVDLAGRVVGESLTDEDRQRRVVDRFLADLEQGDAVGTSAPTGSHAAGGGTA